MDEYTYLVEEDMAGMRIDKYLAQKNADHSRSYLQKLIDDGLVLINGQQTQQSNKIKYADKIVLRVPPATDPEIKAVKIPLDIIFEDKDIIVINKQAGLVVHPAPGHYHDTLVNGLIYYAENLSGINGEKRPGIVHRLDQDTSGVMIVAKNDNSHRELARQFKNRETEKYYLALVKGNVPYEKGKIDAPIGRDPQARKKMKVKKNNSKKAISRFKVKQKFKDFTLLEIKIETGRTHQIRVHLAYMGYPVVGDKKYGRQQSKLTVDRQLLHAYRLGLKHPTTLKWMQFKADLSDDFREALKFLSEN